MKVLVIGADSTIGRALMTAFERRGDVVYGTSRRSGADLEKIVFFDLADERATITGLPKADIVFLSAAITGFAECRRNLELARIVNVMAPVTLASRFAEGGSRVVLLSSSAVFDWRMPRVPASRPPCAVSVYGKLKAEAEAGVLALGQPASVVRFAKVLDSGFKLFNGWIETLQIGKPVTAFSDLRMAPVPLDDAINALLAIAGDSSGGIYQLSGASDVSYFDAAVHLARRLGRSETLITEGRATDAGIRPEEITFYSSLDSSRVAELTGRPAPDPFSVIDITFGPAIERLVNSGRAK